MCIRDRVTADAALHTRDLGGKATTRQVTDAVCARLRAQTAEAEAQAEPQAEPVSA